MSRWRPVFAVALICLIGLAVSKAGLLAAPPFQEDVYFISFPTPGATVSGVVEILGSVAHPNFASYGVFYSPGAMATADSQWQRIAFESQPVINGVLAVWDTTARTEDGQPLVPNGVYTLALARYQQGSSGPDTPLFFVENVIVDNVEEVIPTPTLTPLPTAVPMTPTSVPVEQPPTATPLPSPTPQPGETPVSAATEDEGGGGGVAFDFARLRIAFFEGVRIALLLFGLWGIYVFGKIAFRYYLRTRRPGPRGRM